MDQTIQSRFRECAGTLPEVRVCLNCFNCLQCTACFICFKRTCTVSAIKKYPNCIGFRKKVILSFWVCRLRLAVSWVVKIFAKDPKSWQQMDPSWRWPILQRCRRSAGRSSCKQTKPSFWDSQHFLPKRNQRIVSCVKASKVKSAENGLKKLHRHKAEAHWAFLIIYVSMSYCNIFPKLLSSPIIKCLVYLHYLQMMHIYSVSNVVSPSFWVTRGWKSRQITEWSKWPLRGHSNRWLNGGPKKSCFDSIETQNPWRIDCPVDFEPHKSLYRECVFS